MNTLDRIHHIMKHTAIIQVVALLWLAVGIGLWSRVIDSTRPMNEKLTSAAAVQTIAPKKIIATGWKSDDKVFILDSSIMCDNKAVSFKNLQYDEHLPAVKKTYPTLLVLGSIEAVRLTGDLGPGGNCQGTYTPADFAYSNPQPPKKLVRSDTTKAKDATDGSLIMDPQSKAWVTTRANTCKQLIAKGYDGCVIKTDVTLSGPVWNFVKGRAYTDAEWKTLLTNEIALVRQTVLAAHPQAFVVASDDITLLVPAKNYSF